jgi:tetratricopeptide (TPR) repeat protein
MPLHHYLPAAFLASFSADTSTDPRRERTLCAGDKRRHKTFRAPAARLGAENNLYTLVTEQYAPQMVDETWREYERGLSNAIEALIAGRVDARTWTRVLIPFVACMLVRGPDFAERFGRRMAALDIDDIDVVHTSDNANVARLRELQRLLGPVAVAKWVVVRFPEQGSLLTNDLGYAPFLNRTRGEDGMAVPLGSSHALTVFPRREGRVAVVRSGTWVPDVEYVEALPGDRDGLNRAVSAAARRFIFGPTEDFVEEWLRAAPPAPDPPEPGQLGFITGKNAVAHEFTWHRLAPALERDPSDGGSWDFPLDEGSLMQGWAPMPFFPANLPEFPPAIRREGRSIIGEFYDPTDRFDAARLYDRGVAHFEAGEYDEAVEALDASLQLAPDRVAALYYKGTALAKLGRHEVALKVYDAALELNPGDAEILFNKGIALDELGRPDDAIAAYDEALATEPDHAGALTNKGAILAEQGRDEAALRALGAALEVRPGDADALTNKGGALGNLGRHDEAVEAFGAALEIRPEHELALYYKIVALARQGKEAEADAHLREGWKGRERLSHNGALLAQLIWDLRKEPKK